jgi:hypothetical protein
MTKTLTPNLPIFYVYVLFRPNGVPCYVGKGYGNRLYNHEQRARRGTHENKHLARIIMKAGGSIPAVIIRDQLTEVQALEIEVAFIAAIGRADQHRGPLTNMTDGGDGQTGWVPSQETRRKISKSNTGKILSIEARAKMSAVRKGKSKHSAWCKAIGDAQKDKVIPESARIKMQASSAKRWAKPEERAKIKSYHTNMTLEQRAARIKKITLATRAAMADPAVRAKISAARRR